MSGLTAAPAFARMVQTRQREVAETTPGGAALQIVADHFWKRTAAWAGPSLHPFGRDRSLRLEQRLRQAQKMEAWGNWPAGWPTTSTTC